VFRKALVTAIVPVVAATVAFTGAAQAGTVTPKAVAASTSTVGAPTNVSGTFWEKGLTVRFTQASGNSGYFITVAKVGVQGPVAALATVRKTVIGPQERVIPWRVLASGNKGGAGTYRVTVYTRLANGGYGPGTAAILRNIDNSSAGLLYTPTRVADFPPRLKERIERDWSCTALGVVSGGGQIVAGAAALAGAGAATGSIVGIPAGAVLGGTAALSFATGGGQIVYSLASGCERVSYEI
jgi:hypothetical protein